LRSSRLRAPDKVLSKIFEALKRAELAQPERRRASRIPVHVPLLVYGYTGETPFHEDACSVEVNARGGLISMQTAPRPGQKLLVVNEANETTQQCVVLSIRIRRELGFDVAFEFLTPMPQFWQELEK
jgi:hypothetical protein